MKNKRKNFLLISLEKIFKKKFVNIKNNIKKNKVIYLKNNNNNFRFINKI